MADNGFDIEAQLNAQVTNAENYLNSVADMSTGSIDAAGAILALGAAVQMFQETIAKIDTSKINNFADLSSRMDLVSFAYDLNKNKVDKATRLNFEDIFSKFATSPQQSAVLAEIQKSQSLIGKHSAISKDDLKDKTQTELAALLLSSVNDREKTKTDIAGAKRDIRTATTRDNQEIEIVGKKLSNVFDLIIREEQARLKLSHEAAINDLKNQSRQVKETNQQTYYDAVNKARKDKDAAIWVADRQRKNNLDLENIDYTRNKTIAEANLTTKDGNLLSPKDFKEHIEWLKAYNPNAVTLGDKITDLKWQYKGLSLEAKTDFNKQTKKLDPFSKEYNKYLDAYTQYEAELQKELSRKLSDLKKGNAEASVAEEIARAEILWKQYNADLKELESKHSKNVKEINGKYNSIKSDAIDTSKNKISSARMVYDKAESQRITSFGSQIVSEKERQANETNENNRALSESRITLNNLLETQTITAKENSIRAAQEQINILNQENTAAQNNVNAIKDEIHARNAEARAAKEARKSQGFSARDWIRDSAIREEQMWSYRRGLSGLAMRGAQDFVSWISDSIGKKHPNSAFANMNNIFATKDESGNLIKGSGVNLMSLSAMTFTSIVTAIKGLNNFSKNLSSAFENIESLKTGLSVIYGSKTEANSMFDEIAQYAVKSPFGANMLTEQATLLKQSGVYQSDVMKTLEMLGDIAGGNEERMKRITQDYSRILIMGKANSRELRTFATAGIPIYDVLRKQNNFDQAELNSKLRNNEITAKMVQDALFSMVQPGGQFYNSVNLNADTIKARRQNFQDKRQLALSGLGEWDLSHYNPLGIGDKFLSFRENFTNIIKFFGDIGHDWATGASKANATREYNDATKDYLKIQNYSSSNEYVKKIEDAMDVTFKAQTELYRVVNDEKFKEKYQKLSDRYNSDRDTYNRYIAEGKSDNRIAYAEKVMNNSKKRLDDFIATSEYSAGHFQSYALEASKLMSDFFAKKSEDEKSSLSSNSYVKEQYKSTSLGKYDQFLLDKEKYNTAIETLGIQNKYGIADKGFDWIANIAYGNSEGYKRNPNNPDVLLKPKSDVSFKSMKEVTDLISKFYDGSVYDIDATSLNEDTIKQLIDNAHNLYQLSANTFTDFTEDDWKEASEHYKNYISALTGPDFSKMNKKEKQSAYTDIATEAGRFQEWVNGLEDEVKKTLFSAFFLNPESNLLDPKQVEELKRENHKKYAAFWERYAVSSLGISLDGLIDGKSITSQYKEKNYREQSQAIAKAMLQTMSADKVFNNRLISGNGGIDQTLTAHSFENAAISLSTSADATKAYLEHLENQRNTLTDFLAGAPFKAEDAEKLYDPIWANEKGYKNRESFVDAYSQAMKEGGETAKQFTLSLQGSIAELLEETKLREKQARVGYALKSAAEDAKSALDEKTAENQIEDLANATNRGFQGSFAKWNILPNEELKNELTKIKDKFKDSDNKFMLSEFEKFLNYTQTGRMPTEYAGATTRYNEYIQTRDSDNELIAQKQVELKQKQDEIDAKRKELPKMQIGNTNFNWKQFSNPLNSLENANNSRLTTQEEIDKLQEEANVLQGEINRINEKQKTENKVNESELAANAAMESLYKNPSLPASVTSISNLNRISNNKLGYLKVLAGLGITNLGSFSEQPYDFLKSIVPANLNIRTWKPKGKTGNTLEEQIAANYFSGTEYQGDFNQYFEDVFTKNGVTTDYLNDVYAQYNKMNPKDQKELTPGTSIEEAKRIVLLTGNQATKLENIKSAYDKLNQTVVNSSMTAVFDGINNSLKEMGESIRTASWESENFANVWKGVATNMLDALSPAMAQAGLDLIMNDKVGAGMALLGASGVASFVSGLLSDSSDSDNNQNEERIKTLKDALSDLIDQAKTDAEYYEKNYLHKTALSANYDYTTRSVNDAVITPTGNVISTAPDDYLIATKKPDTLMGNTNNTSVTLTPTINCKVINQTSRNANAEVRQTTDENGNIDFEVILKNAVSSGIADGSFDDAFDARDSRIKGRSVAW